MRALTSTDENSFSVGARVGTVTLPRCLDAAFEE
jgi:hypothetical protein